jgi:2-haloacid dehalogenase
LPANLFQYPKTSRTPGFATVSEHTGETSEAMKRYKSLSEKSLRRMPLLNFDAFEVLTFDCYGTLIDWETGISEALQPILANHHIDMATDRLLELYGELEFEAEREKYYEYKTVLRTVLEGLGARLGFAPTPTELQHFTGSVKDWPAFPDSVRALQALQRKYKLAVISNIDDDLFALSAPRLQVKLDWVITAQQAQSYKPSLNNFHLAFARIGLPKSKILHVAQSLFHDVAPAKTLGLSTVWVNRRHNKDGFGATPPAHVQPDLEVPSLQALAGKIGL